MGTVQQKDLRRIVASPFFFPQCEWVGNWGGHWIRVAPASIAIHVTIEAGGSGMAWLEKRGSLYRVVFQIGGISYKRSLGIDDEREAAGRVAAIERRIQMVERGELAVPEESDLPAFLLEDGKSPSPATVKNSCTVKQLIDQFIADLPAGSIEENSLYTLNIHLAHIVRLLTPDKSISRINFAALQDYVNKRSGETGRRGQPISPTTIRKELSSFSGVWNWGIRMNKTKVAYPNKGLRYAKTTDKPPFQTWKEIERQIACGGLSEIEEAELWDCLYLRIEEVVQLLEFVKRQSSEPFLYPMLVMAAHTGARRSEIARSQKRDFDFDAGTVLVREKKRSKGRATNRSVPMTEQLAKTMKAWLEEQPGPAAFTHLGEAIIPERASDEFSKALAGSRWEKLRGWHVLRHSFVSNLASRAIDQRLIDEFVGHTTEAMRRRYRHLFPETKRAAISAVFG